LRKGSLGAEHDWGVAVKGKGNMTTMICWLVASRSPQPVALGNCFVCSGFLGGVRDGHVTGPTSEVGVFRGIPAEHSLGRR